MIPHDTLPHRIKSASDSTATCYDDWRNWKFTEPQTVIKSEKDYEGVNEPVEPSRFGSTNAFVHQLRDPGLYEENGRLFLLDSTAGERAIALAELFFEEKGAARRPTRGRGRRRTNLCSYSKMRRAYPTQRSVHP